VPVAVQVPALGVRARVVAAGVAGAGDALALPGDAATVAWYRHGPAPGERGSSVLAGHVDYRGERGVFGRIGELALGASVSVAYADGTSRGFRVVARRAYRKTRLPRELLFSTTGRARLALVTCGGRFDRQSGHYESNVVVFALPAADAGGAAG
jgi:hypothetical protein